MSEPTSTKANYESVRSEHKRMRREDEEKKPGANTASTK